MELDAEERSLHATLDVGVEAIISAEEILMFKAALEASRYDDATLIYDLCHGFPIIGTAPVSGNFEQRSAPAKISVATLMETEKWSQKALAGSSRCSDDCELEQVVYAETLEERNAGLLMGPYSRDEVTKSLGRVWVVARRFGVRQGAKTRSIVDFSEF